MTAIKTVAPWLRCPVCGVGLTLVGRSLICSRGHAFDIAKQGYVNLVGHSAPSNADTVAMVAARHRFLSAGHYDPITDVVAAAITGARRLLEVGAGTGHHLARILDQLPSAHALAADISVPASRRAAKAHPRMAAVVADTWAGLPLTDRSVDAVLCLFAPRNPAEFQRVLVDDGVVIVVVPKPDHLQELRDAHALLEVGQDKVDRLLQSSITHLDLVDSTDITHELDLSADEATDLVAMGPNAFHTDVRAPATHTKLSVTCLTFRVVHTPSR